MQGTLSEVLVLLATHLCLRVWGEFCTYFTSIGNSVARMSTAASSPLPRTTSFGTKCETIQSSVLQGEEINAFPFFSSAKITSVVASWKWKWCEIKNTVTVIFAELLMFSLFAESKWEWNRISKAEFEYWSKRWVCTLTFLPCLSRLSRQPVNGLDWCTAEI